MVTQWYASTAFEATDLDNKGNYKIRFMKKLLFNIDVAFQKELV